MKNIREYKILTSRRQVVVTAIICLALLGYVDWITGPNVAITCFYLIPVCLLTWFAGRRIGYIASAIHALVWLAIDADTVGILSLLAYWNAVVRFLLFAVIVWLVYLCKNLTAEIEKLIRDKTEVLQREVESRAAAAEAMRRLANEVSSAEDAERRRLGQELHDSLGQSLALLKLRLESLCAEMPGESKVSLELKDAVGFLGEIIQSSRTLTFELHPSMLDQLGLTVTLRHYADQVAAQTKAAIRVVDFGPAMTLPAPIASFLFRAAKELLTNALKHGKAHDLLVQVRRQEGRVRVVVNDDGRGFRAQSEQTAGIGLAWIKERLRSFGGSLEVESMDGQGARVAMDLPVEVSG
jgi:signal transduction histidine kinase